MHDDIWITTNGRGKMGIYVEIEGKMMPFKGIGALDNHILGRLEDAAHLEFDGFF